MSLIFVFDDDQEEREALVREIEEIDDRSSVVEFLGAAPLGEDQGFEEHIAEWLQAESKEDQVSLIVCDKELGKYTNLRGLSAAPVSAVALELGLPFCLYSREAAEKDLARFERLRQWDSEEITLRGEEPETWAQQVASLLAGFEQIAEKSDGTTDARPSPAASLAQILGKPEMKSRIGLYGSGDQTLLREVMVFYDPESPNVEALQRRMPRILGSWLFLSILRFPGVLANEIAAASYLNIAEQNFRDPAIQSHFSVAKYAGPFHELGPWWWRGDLDNLVGGAEAIDGREYLEKQGVEVNECVDPTDGTRAGYYCMLTRKPVSRENSQGGINWFPSGADLARIRKDKFEEITALVGTY